MIGRTQGLLAATACVLMLGACSAPEERSDLRPRGAPEVLTVLVANDAAGDGILEGATFCKLNDDKRPGLVPALLAANPDAPAQVCPDALGTGAAEVTDGVPLGWYVRIQFDELLDPDIEDLLPIPDSELLKGSLARTQPVTLTCAGANVAYDGYYNVSGNSLTWPLGPSLFIAPVDEAAYTSIPTGSDCTVTIKPDVVIDKDGERVPTAQVGPYSFKLAELSLLGTDPEAPRDPKMPGTVAPEDPLILTFNAHINVTSLSATDVLIQEVTACDGTGAIDKIAVVREHEVGDDDEVDPASIEIVDAAAPTDAAFVPEKTYLITFRAGANVTQDIAGGGNVDLPLAAELSICFKTDELSP
jgi:hypothetical protein